ncbi:MAG: S24 family peptidase [Gammaproteobacteria bacterium]|nr:MAG: S24 family peptidase [Gammaproteobacteria bacterium]
MDNQFSGGCSTNDTLVALQVIADDMEPEFEPGNVVVVDPTGYATHESFVIALYDDNHELRQLLIDKSSGEQRYFLRTLKTGKLEELDDLERVKGVVVQRNGKRINGKRNIKHYR